MDHMKEAKVYGERAFSCWLCHKTFDYENRTTKGDLKELHNQAHIARFFNDIFVRSEVRSAYYEYHRRILMMATFRKMGDTM